MAREDPVPAPLGRSHPLVRKVRLLSRSASERAAARLILAEGIHLACEAAALPGAIETALWSPRLIQDPRGGRLLDQLSRSGVPVRQMSDALLDSLHDSEAPQGILVLARRASAGVDIIPSAGAEAVGLVACGVQDPGNAGALVRVAEAAGCRWAAMLGGADPFGPRAARASAGSILRLAVVRLAEEQEPELARVLKDGGYTFAGASPRGGQDYREARLTAPLALFVGGESAGLPGAIEARLQQRLTIPLRGPVESLNVAAAAAVLLFQIAGSLRSLPSPARPGPAGPPAPPARSD